ncbi:Nucleolar complex protein 2 -like protein [Caligus rogercresseyi]|uniref:Nucleolar complex protein 2 -like protein n=1 Tax=Caligus rogercresseyi TaxID=217165 RepID=A0A7T8KD30_CALRO|nr:Nucleolar complex protein 2 -like protein [Caligus rogercresseyi]
MRTLLRLDFLNFRLESLLNLNFLPTGKELDERGQSTLLFISQAWISCGLPIPKATLFLRCSIHLEFSDNLSSSCFIFLE